MGVEYAHYYVVRDLSWIGTMKEAEGVHDLLEQWELVSDPIPLFDLSGGAPREVEVDIDELTWSPRDFALIYPGVGECKYIEEIMGPSIYPEADSMSRYFQKIEFVCGTDFRIHPSDERFYVDTGTIQILESSLPTAFAPFDGTVMAEPGSPPPRVTMKPGRLPAPEGFTGVWRTALRFDCGKDVPAFAEHSTTAPGTEFLNDLCEVLGTDVLQIGFVY